MGRNQRRGFWSHLPYSLAFLGLLILILAGVNFLSQGNRGGKLSAVDAPPPVWAATDRQVDQLQERLRLQPTDAESYLQLGGVYLQKTRDTGDLSYYARAEEATLKALELSPNDARAMTLLGALMLGRHQFQEAEQWARRSLEINSHDASAYGVLGDAQVELGQYEAAIESFQAMVDLKPNLSSYARVSYARELMGGVAGAIEAMQMAVASGRSGTESAAWAQVQLGDLYFNSGRIDAAAEHYQAAMRAFPGYHVALAALGKVRSAQGRYDEAIQLYRKAIAIVPQPATLTALGDLYARVGQKEQAQLQYDTVELIARLAAINQQVYNRELSLFYSDHETKLDEALSLAQKEIAIRQDIHGYDTLAWALYKNNRPVEAASAMTSAMKLGTQNPILYYHAGMIHYRLGDRAKAEEHLQHALALNPHFSILFEDEARQTLAELGGAVAWHGGPGVTTP